MLPCLDKSEKNDEIVRIAKKFEWIHGDKIVNTFEYRQGLRKHIIKCGDLSIKYGAVIILEDDLVVSPDYYNYTVKALNYYKTCKKVTGIALYSHQWNGYASRFFHPIQEGADVYFGQFGISWGQCWSSIHWQNFKKWYKDNQGELTYSDKIPHQITDWPDSSWGKYFNHYIVEKDKYYVIPYFSLTTNFTDIGQHAIKSDSAYQVPLLFGGKDFNFVSYEKAIKYDIFFESQNLYKNFTNIMLNEGICIDLYSSKKSYGNNRYLLSTSLKDYKVIKSFGLQMRPHEMNIIFDIPGNDIYLYDMNFKSNMNKKTNNNASIYNYDLRGFNWRQILPYAFNLFSTSVKNKIHENNPFIK